MTQTYLRAQRAERDVTDLLDPEHVSYSWDNEESGDLGTSTCGSLEDLYAYLAQTGISIGVGDWVIVEVAGDARPGRDAHMGEWLVMVDEIVAVRPFDEDDYEAIGRIWDELEG